LEDTGAIGRDVATREIFSNRLEKGKVSVATLLTRRPERGEWVRGTYFFAKNARG